MRFPITTDIIDLGPELFASSDLRVISFKGENYYKVCGQTVWQGEDGSSSSCIFPLHHPYWKHQDWEGRENDRLGITDYDYVVRSEFRKALTRSGLDDTQVFNAMNALQTAGLQLSVSTVSEVS